MNRRLKILISKPPLLYLAISFIFLFTTFAIASTLNPIASPPSSTYALSFYEANYVEVPNSKSLNINGSLTLQFWVNSFEFRNGRILTKGSYSEGNYFTSWRVDGMVEFIVTNDETGEWSPNQIMTPVLELNTWYHITFVYDKDAGLMQAYVNGEITTEKSVGSFKLRNGAWTVKIGKGEDDNPFHGLIDDVLIFNRALSQAEIQENMHGHTTSRNLVGWWKFEEGVGNIAVDSSPYRNDGVIYGEKWTRLETITSLSDKISSYFKVLFSDDVCRVLLIVGVSFLSIGFPWIIAEYLVAHIYRFARLSTKPRIRSTVTYFKENPSCAPILIFIASFVIIISEYAVIKSFSEELLGYTLGFLLMGILLQFVKSVSAPTDA